VLNQQNLVREGIPDERVFVTGNTGIDALRYASTLDVPFADDAVTGVFDSGRPYVVVTAHRRENWDGGLARIGAGLAAVAAQRPDVSFVVSLHPNPLVREQLGVPLGGLDNVVLTEPLGYAEFARLLGRATIVVTDSGGIQEEAPALGVPVLVARESTERIEGVHAGTLRLVGTGSDSIAAATAGVLADPGSFAVDAAQNPYGDGRASERIVAALEYLAGYAPPPQEFGPGFSRREVLEAAGYPFGMFSTPPEERGVQPDRQEEHDRWVAR